MERRIGQASGVKPRGSRRSGYFLAAAATDQCQQVPCGSLRSRVRIHDVGGSASIPVACRVAARGPTEQLDQLEVASSWCGTPRAPKWFTAVRIGSLWEPGTGPGRVSIISYRATWAGRWWKSADSQVFSNFAGKASGRESVFTGLVARMANGLR